MQCESESEESPRRHHSAIILRSEDVSILSEAKDQRRRRENGSRRPCSRRMRRAIPWVFVERQQRVPDPSSPPSHPSQVRPGRTVLPAPSLILRFAQDECILRNDTKDFLQN